MGIYSALAASEAISFEEGLFHHEAIGRLLKREGALHRGGMASIIGLPLGGNPKDLSRSRRVSTLHRQL